MMRRTPANMASFYTEQQSLDVKEGLARRVQEGWFVGKAPYGFLNVRKDGRCVTTTDDTASATVKRIFQLYAYEPLTLDALRDRLHSEHVIYRPETPNFTRSKLHHILSDRSYIGEVPFKGQWYPGKQEVLIERQVWDRVRSLFSGHVYHAHQMTYAGELITCGHCGRAVTGEQVTKKTKSGEKRYVYYRCSGYTKPGHPRDRVPEPEFDRQMLAIFDQMRIKDESVREWFAAVLASQTRDAQADAKAQRSELQRQATLLVNQQDRLLNLRLGDEIDQEAFARKHTELRDRLASIKQQLDVLDRSHDETAELASKVFELSQTLQNKWLEADYTEKRRILEIVCLNFSLESVNLVPTMRKPFDMLTKGLHLENNRGERI